MILKRDIPPIEAHSLIFLSLSADNLVEQPQHERPLYVDGLPSREKIRMAAKVALQTFRSDTDCQIGCEFNYYTSGAGDKFSGAGIDLDYFTGLQVFRYLDLQAGGQEGRFCPSGGGGALDAGSGIGNGE